MSRRPVVTIHLPLEMGAAAAIMKAVAREFPDAVVGNTPAGDVQLIADDSPSLTPAQRRAMAKRGFGPQGSASAAPDFGLQEFTRGADERQSLGGRR